MKSVRHVAVLFTALFLSLAVQAGNSNNAYPQGPDSQLTPGDVCDTGNVYRYPEHIRYCNRDVDSQTKKDIIRTYDQNRGYAIESMPRSQFKIDHYIPLCMGGSNDRDNLWPQHETVYTLTDPLEQLECQKMADGKLSQADAIRLMKQAKNDLSQVSAIIKQVNAL